MVFYSEKWTTRKIYAMLPNTGTSKKKLTIFCVTHFRKWKQLYRFITQSEIFQAFISWHFYDYGLQIMKTHNSVSQKIIILHKIIKKRIFKKDMSSFWKVCSFICAQYLFGPPFAWITALMQRGMIYCINVAWHGGNQPVALLRYNESPGCFD